MINDYMQIEVDGIAAMLKTSSKHLMGKLDAILFDCDGVLIDVRGSYDLAIKLAVDFLIKAYFSGIDETIASDEQIEALRMCGGFNNDWDTTYTLSEWSFLSMPEDGIRSFSKAFKSLDPGLTLKEIVDGLSSRSYAIKMNPELGVSRQTFIKMLDGLRTSYGFVDRNLLDSKVIEPTARKRDLVDELTPFRRYIGYPGRFGESLLITIFDELFYGSEGIRTIYGSEPIFNTGDGLFLKDRPIVDERCLIELDRIVGSSKMALVTGRDRWTTGKVLGKMYRYFNERASVFLADEVRLIGLEALAVGKPDPYCIMKSISYLQPDGPVLYVGDSAEDLQMVKRANDLRGMFLFVGVYGSSTSPERRYKYFVENGADAIIQSVNLLPGLLMKVVEV